MAGSRLAMAQSTQLVLPLSPRFEHGARVLVQRYAHSWTLTVLDERTPGYFCFIHRSLIFTYFCIAL